jgi:hypothetical protein
MENERSGDDQVGYGSTPASADARIVIDFGVGPDGVGPVMGFESDDFFRSAREADRDPMESTDTLGTAMVR